MKIGGRAIIFVVGRRICRKQLTGHCVDIIIEQNYGIIAGPVTSYGQVSPVVGLAGLMKEARKAVISGICCERSM